MNNIDFSVFPPVETIEEENCLIEFFNQEMGTNLSKMQITLLLIKAYKLCKEEGGNCILQGHDCEQNNLFIMFTNSWANRIYLQKVMEEKKIRYKEVEYTSKIS